MSAERPTCGEAQSLAGETVATLRPPDGGSDQIRVEVEEHPNDD